MKTIRLSPRERQVVAQLPLDKSNKEIGADLGLSVAVVKFHLRNACAKAGVHTRCGLLVQWLDGRIT
ncbi:MAG TPA: helix-turn-helix transcriptional regulator [Verrucomicrobiae bacterium]|nr:helix-turn-helix transcriptional regulator [Verrucomicrobiae bacterium]